MSTGALRELVKMATQRMRMRVEVHAATGGKAANELEEICHAARVLTRPMDFTTDEYVKASALLKALAEEHA